MKISRISRLLSLFCLSFIFVSISFFGGCSSSEEAQNQDIDALTSRDRFLINQLNTSLDSIKRQNAILKEDLERSRQTASNLNIKLSTLQRELDELKNRTSEYSLTDAYIDEYRKALNLFNAKKYKAAIEKFQKLYTEDPSAELAPNCMYWIGECYYGLKNYKQALITFNQVLNSYPSSTKSDDALIMIGMSQLKLKNRKEAKEAFEKLQELFPESEYIQKIPKEFLINSDDIQR